MCECWLELALQVDVLEELLVQMILFVLVGGEGVLWGLECGQLEIW